MNVFASFGQSHLKSDKSKQAINKDINKSDAVVTEAAQLLQSFDDVSAVFSVSDAKLVAITNKVSARLAPDIVALCVSDEGDLNQQDRGLKVVSSLRSLKLKLSAVLPLVQSLMATKGDKMHHTFLEAGLKQARAADVKVVSAIDDVLAVRHVTALAESQDWENLCSKIADGLSNLTAQSQIQVASGGCVHAIEAVMRPPLADSGDVSKEAKDDVAVARCLQIAELVSYLRGTGQRLWNKSDFTTLCTCLHHLECVCRFAEREIQRSSMTSEEIKEVEAARAILFRKESPLIKCLTAFPLGAWLGELLQESLADYHAQAAVASAFLAASLELSQDRMFFFFFDLSLKSKSLI